MSTPFRKSALDVPGFQEMMKEAAEADGVALRKPALPAFNAVTPATVAAATSEQNLGTPNRDPAAVSTSKVEGPASAEFDVDLALLDPLPTNSRFDYTDAEVDKMLADLIREGKQLKPIELTVSDEDPERFYTVDGFTRKLALLKWGKTTGRAIMVNVTDPWERYKASWYANNGSRHTTDYDNGMRWKDMIDKKIIAQPQISIQLGEKFSAGNVSRIMSISKLPEAARNFVREHKFKLSSNFYYEAYLMMGELRSEDPEEKVLAMLKMVVDEDLSAREFTKRIEAHLKALNTNAAPADTSKLPATDKLSFGGKNVGEIKEWFAKEELTISLKKVPAELRDQVKEAVRKILEGAPADATTS